MFEPLRKDLLTDPLVLARAQEDKNGKESKRTERSLPWKLVVADLSTFSVLANRAAAVLVFEQVETV
jgi:hypothetical protein